MKKRFFPAWIIPLAVVLVLAGVFFWFHTHPVTVSDGQASIDTTQLKTTQVQTGSLSSIVGASGTVHSNQTANLAWKTDGVVSQVLVKKGQVVQAGQILAQLDPSSSTTIVNAQADLLTVQADMKSAEDQRVAQAQAQVDLANAQAALTSAQNTLTAVQQPPTKAAIESAYSVYLNDVSQVSKLQDNYNRALQQVPIVFFGQVFLSSSQIELMQSSDLATLSNEEQKRDNDLAYYNSLLNWTVDPNLLKKDQQAVDIAQQQLDSAQATVATAPDTSQVSTDQAKLTNDQAIIDEQYLRANFSGTVTDLALKPGDLVEAGSYGLRLDDLSSLLIDLQVAEVDINSIHIGQAASLSFDGIPQKDYTSLVSSIDQVGKVSNGLSSFTVTLTLQNADALVKPGMTAEATITTQSTQNALIVPIHAITEQAVASISGAATQERIYVLRNNEAVPVIITTGISSDTQIIVTSGDLHAGDVVITNPAAIPAAQATHTSTLRTILHSLGLIRYSS